MRVCVCVCVCVREREREREREGERFTGLALFFPLDDGHSDLGWLWVSQVALVVKNPPATAGD